MWLYNRTGVGVTGDIQTMFYVEVTNDMKKSQGKSSTLVFILFYKLRSSSWKEKNISIIVID